MEGTAEGLEIADRGRSHEGTDLWVHIVCLMCLREGGFAPVNWYLGLGGGHLVHLAIIKIYAREKSSFLF